MQMVERLLEAGANAQLVDMRGYTALQCAAEGGHMGPFRSLLQAGCDPLAWDHAGVTVLHSACQGGSVEIVKHLMQLGAQPLTKSLLGRDALHYAARGMRSLLHAIPSACFFLWVAKLTTTQLKVTNGFCICM